MTCKGIRRLRCRSVHQLIGVQPRHILSGKFLRGSGDGVDLRRSDLPRRHGGANLTQDLHGPSPFDLGAGSTTSHMMAIAEQRSVGPSPSVLFHVALSDDADENHQTIERSLTGSDTGQQGLEPIGPAPFDINC